VIRNVDEVIVSLDGPREIHDKVRRVAGGFDLLSRGVKALLEIDPEFPVSGRCTVQKLNCTRLRETVDAVKEIGLRSISFLAADVESTAFNRPSPLSVIESSPFALSLDDVVALEREIEDLARERANDFARGFIAESPDKLRRIPHHFRAHLGLEDSVAPRCNAPWVSAVMETDGALRPCFFHDAVGNVFTEGLTGALNSSTGLTFRSELQIAENPVCRRCVCSLYRG
jgi:MoaA/NifB/PqqE/SkfB family radical SAM enzyme